MAALPIGVKAKAKNIQRIVWMPIGQPIPSESVGLKQLNKYPDMLCKGHILIHNRACA